MKIEVYTYFGRVLKVWFVSENELHHAKTEEARKWLLAYEKETGQPAWARFKW
jgi:hypothetical protein